MIWASGESGIKLRGKELEEDQQGIGWTGLILNSSWPVGGATGLGKAYQWCSLYTLDIIWDSRRFQKSEGTAND